MKKILAIMLSAVMIFGLTACDSSSKKIIGTWNCHVDLEEDDLLENLDFLSFTESEMSFADTKGAYFIETVKFNDDKTYSLAFNTDASEAAFAEYLDKYFHTLFDNRMDVEEYGIADDDFADFEEYGLWYASLFEYDSYEEMVADMADYIVGLYEFTPENGTYTVSSKHISFKPAGEDAAETEYLVTDTELTIVYVDGTRVYTKQ